MYVGGSMRELYNVWMRFGEKSDVGDKGCYDDDAGGEEYGST